MPRGKPGTGPFARKRLQHALTQLEDTYMRLPLTEAEARAVYYCIHRTLASGWGRVDSLELQNVVYRITEHAAALQLGLPIKMLPHEYGEPKEKQRRKQKRP